MEFNGWNKVDEVPAWAFTTVILPLCLGFQGTGGGGWGSAGRGARNESNKVVCYKQKGPIFLFFFFLLKKSYF